MSMGTLSYLKITLQDYSGFDKGFGGKVQGAKLGRRVKPRVPSLLPYWEQDRVSCISVLFSPPFKQGICLPHLVQHMPCKISVNAIEETHRR